MYENALAQVQKNEETEKIVQADGVRDKAVSAFSLALKLHAASDDPEEAEASRSLGILFGTFKNMAKMNYEAESLAIDKLVSELNSPAYSEKITALYMTKYVTRLTDTNATFKALFSGRMVGSAMTENLRHEGHSFGIAEHLQRLLRLCAGYGQSVRLSPV